MSEQPRPAPGDESPPQVGEPKPVEKVKSDDEKLPEKFKVEGEKFQKEIEKVKSDHEKLPEKLKVEGEKFQKEIEKVKSDHEKLPEKLKVEGEKFQKEIEKVKSDHEKLPEKLKVEGEKLPFEKLPVKEHKPEKLEFEKAAKIEAEKTTQEAEGVPLQPDQLVRPPIDRDTLLRHAEALERLGSDLRHFIEQEDRPDLSRGALHDEPDRQGDTENG